MFEGSKPRVVGVQMKEPMISRLDEYSKKKDISKSDVVRMAINQFLDREDASNDGK